jgi:hypothetical protein
VRIKVVRRRTLKKLVFSLALAGAMTLIAATGAHRLSLVQDSIIDGKQVKAGDYKLEMKDANTAVLKHGKQTIELPAREESAPQKFSTTEMEYTNNNELKEIRFGSSNTKIVFSGVNGTTAGGGQ